MARIDSNRADHKEAQPAHSVEAKPDEFAAGRNGAVGAKLAADPAAAALITAEQAVRLQAVPVRIDDARLHVAMSDATDFAAADEISVSAGRPVTRIEVTKDVLTELIRAVYGTTASQMAARLGGEGGDADHLIANL